MKDFSCCSECGEKLKQVNHQRTRPKLCASCRGDKVGGNSEIRQMFLEMQKNPPPESAYEGTFEDDPRALKEIEYGRVVKNPTEIHGGETSLAEIMMPTSTYKHKKGSARDGFRYTREESK